MKRVTADALIALFVLLIVGASSQAGRTHIEPGDVAGALGVLTVYLLLFVGLFYSGRWRMKLSGHNHRVGRQTTAVILFWYSLLGILIGLVAAFGERDMFGLVFGAVMVAIWSGSAYACKRWLRRLRAEERGYLASADVRPSGVQFGFEEEWAEFAKTNPIFMQRFTNLRTALDTALTRTEATREPVDRVVYFCGRLCAEDFFEILLLCGNGYGVGGWKILRGMYERAVTARYLYVHPGEAEAFLDFHPIAMHKLAKAIEDTMGRGALPSDRMQKVEAEYQRVKDRFMVTDCERCGTKRLNHTWSKLDFVSMAKAAGDIGKLIVPAYYLPLRHAHSTVGAILDRLEASESGGLVFNSGPQREAARDALRCAHEVLLNVLKLQSEHFALKSLDAPLQVCNEDFRDIWGGMTA